MNSQHSQKVFPSLGSYHPPIGLFFILWWPILSQVFLKSKLSTWKYKSLFRQSVFSLQIQRLVIIMVGILNTLLKQRNMNTFRTYAQLSGKVLPRSTHRVHPGEQFLLQRLFLVLLHSSSGAFTFKYFVKLSLSKEVEHLIQICYSIFQQPVWFGQGVRFFQAMQAIV